MRKIIIFRGKRLDNGEWIEGAYVKIGALHTIVTDYYAREVNPDTIGQYTGLADISGVQIFEGDIVEFVLKPVHPSGNPETLTGVVVWQDEDAKFVIDSRPYGSCRYGMKFAPKGKIIGNIHDK